MQQLALVSRAAAVLVLGIVGCGGDLTLPADGGLKLAILRGDDQVGTVGQALPDSVVVVVRSDADTPLPDRQVAFVGTGNGSGAFVPDTAVTDSAGEAWTRWVLGPTPGPYAAEARVVLLAEPSSPVVALKAAAVAGDPDTVRAAGPTIQGGRRGEPLPEPLVVMVVDRFGNPVGGAAIRWRVEEGNGEISPEESVTGPDGSSSVTWTLGNRIGVQRAAAEVEGASGSPVIFSATVLFF